MKSILALLAAAPVAMTLAEEPGDAAPLPPPQVQIGGMGAKDREDCRDTIRLVREQNGQPTLEREPASPDKPYFIAAVDKRVGDCSVMVMRHDTNDIRPLPEPRKHAPLLMPAR